MKVYLQNNIKLLKFSGLWVIGHHDTKKTAYRFYSTIIAIFFVFLDTLFMMLNVPNISDDWERSSSHLTILAAKIMGFTKLIMFIKNRNIVSSIMDSLVFKCFRSDNQRQRKIMDESFYLYTIAFKVFSMAGLTSFSLYVSLPLIMGQEMALPFDSWYPFDYKKEPWYLLTYGHQTLATFFISSSNIGIDTFSVGLMRVLSCQCEMLADRLVNLDEENVDFDEFYREIAEHHEEILK